MTAVNAAPVAAADSVTTDEDNAVTIAVLGNDSDVDGDALSLASVTQGANGTVVINPDNTLNYTPDADFNASDSFSTSPTLLTGRRSRSPLRRCSRTTATSMAMP